MINDGSTLKNKTIKAKKGITFYNLILEYCEAKENVKDIAICKLNGKYHELTEEIQEDGEIELIGFDTELGIKI